MSTHGSGTGAASSRQRSSARTARATSPTISPKGVAGWTRGNAPGVPRIGYHYGTADHIARLRERGANVMRGMYGTYGTGFYMFDRPSTLRNPNEAGRLVYGDQPMVRVAIRMRNPWIGTPSQFGERFRDAYLEALRNAGGQTVGTDNSDEVATAVRAAGYDGVIIRDSLRGHGSASQPERDQAALQVVAIVPGSVRIISETDAAARAAAQRAIRAEGQATSAPRAARAPRKRSR